MMIRVLVVDDEEAIRGELAEALEEEGYETCQASSGDEALALVSENAFDLCLTDIRMPGMSGLHLLKRLGEIAPETLVIMMTAYGETRSAIDALRSGAADYLLKPFKIEDLLARVKRLETQRRLEIENRNLRQVLRARSEMPVSGMIGESDAMKRIVDLIDRVASLPSNVLITGESGTGKELVARAIHERGERCEAPFVPINCAAIPEALLESELFGHVEGAFTGAVGSKEGLLRTAGRGTLFLDELGEMPLALQAKLLRALENRMIQPLGATRRIPIEARIIAASHRDLKAESASGQFREDLYYRLAVVEIPVPPLRDRRGDIPLLVRHFIETFNPQLRCRVGGVDGEAMRLLCGHGWKGNVRELANTIERAMIFSDGEQITVANLPEEVRRATPAASCDALDLKTATHRFEVDHINRVIGLCDGNKRKAAKVLGMGVTTLYRKLGHLNESGQSQD